MNKCYQFKNFCYVCGKFVISPSQRKITVQTADLYQKYFSLEVFRDVNWAPDIVCTTCVINLNKWKKTGAAMPIYIPMIWRDPNLHDSDNCYACLNYIIGTNRKKSGCLSYTETIYVQLPVPHSHEHLVPRRPSLSEEYMPLSFATDKSAETVESMYQPSNVTAPCNHIEITQNRLDIWIRRLKLSQRQSIIMAKGLKQVNILAPDVRIYGAINRHSHFTNFFKSIENNSLAYCTNICGLISTMQNEYNPMHWRLFINSSKSSLKAVLLHVTNSKNSVPIALSTNTKETYESLRKIIDLVKYNDLMWKICADLKVVTLLRGMQTGYTKNMCFMCLWDTRFPGDQYSERNWPPREDFRLRRNNIINIPLVPVEKVLLPPLHIKLGIVKNFIKALSPEREAFHQLRRIFPRLSGMKIKEGILNGPDIRRLTRDELFENALSPLEHVAWDCVKAVIDNVLGIHRSENWRILIEDMLTAFHNINVHMSLKIHFLHCHAEKFNEQTPAESDEHGERFHQVTARLEHWYSGKKLYSLLGDICWKRN